MAKLAVDVKFGMSHANHELELLLDLLLGLLDLLVKLRLVELPCKDLTLKTVLEDRGDQKDIRETDLAEAVFPTEFQRDRLVQDEVLKVDQRWHLLAL